MPLHLGPLKEQTKRLNLTLEGNTFFVVYRPYAITPQIEEQIAEAVKDNQRDLVIELFRFVVVDWDVIDSEDPDGLRVIPLEEVETIKKQVPSPIIAWIMAKIQEDNSPNRKPQRETLRFGS